MTQAGVQEDAMVEHQSVGSRLKTITVGYLNQAVRGENSGALILAMIVIIAIFAIALRDTNYLSATNLLGIVRQTAAITVMAIPTVFVISSGEIDLSIAAVVPVAAFIAALLLPNVGFVGAVAAALAFGALVGFLNGIITVRFQIPSFVVTLGMLSVLNGLSLRITNVLSISIVDPTYLKVFGEGHVGPVPALVLWPLAVAIAGHIVLTYTPIGKAVLATGANEAAARFSGIRTKRVKVAGLVASGLAGALAGLIYSGQFAAASYTLGTTDLLTVIAAVIIGGTALMGGKGSVVGAVVGSLLIGTLNNGLVIIGLANPEQLMARGLIIIAAVMFSARTRVRGSRAGTQSADSEPEAVSSRSQSSKEHL